MEDADELADIDRVFDVEFCRANPETHGNELRTGMTPRQADRGGLVGLSEGVYKAGPELPQESAARAWACSTTRCASARTGQSNQKIVFSSSFLLYDAEPTKADQKGVLCGQRGRAAVEQGAAPGVYCGYGVANGGGIIDLTWWMLPPVCAVGPGSYRAAGAAEVDAVFCRRHVFCAHPACVLTAPDTYFMYYLTPFIAGYAVAAAGVLYAVMRRKLKVERNPG